MSIQLKRRLLGFCFILVLSLSVLNLPHPCSNQAVAANSAVKKKFVIGGLFAMTGSWSTLGLASAAALQLAADDLNAHFSRIGSKIEVE